MRVVVTEPSVTTVNRTQALRRLSKPYATALRLHERGRDDDIPSRLRIEPEAVRPLLQVAEAKLARLLGHDVLDAKGSKGGIIVDQICLVLPILPGKTAAARDFHGQLDGARKPDYDASERRIGISKEVWYIAATPAGDQLVAYIESEDFTKALSMFVQSREEFDVWFKQHLAEATGVDLNDPPELTLPELVSSYRTS
jgi:hypothetical protein